MLHFTGPRESRDQCSLLILEMRISGAAFRNKGKSIIVHSSCLPVFSSASFPLSTSTDTVSHALGDRA